MPGTQLQKKLSRVRPPRVRIVPSLSEGNDTSAIELPFHIAVIANLGGGTTQPYRERRFVEIDRDNFDSVLQSMRPLLRFSVEDKLSEDSTDVEMLSVDLNFKSMDDFSPGRVAWQVPQLAQLLNLRKNLRQLRDMINRDSKLDELLTQALYNPKPDTPIEDLSERIACESRVLGAEAMAAAKDCVAEFLRQVLEGEMAVCQNVEATILARMAQIDYLLSAQINEILHHSMFQKLEASWRGLAYLVFQGETSSNHRMYVLNAKKREIVDDVRAAADFRDTDLYSRVSEPLDTLGGAPYGCIVADYSFDASPESFETLDELARMARAVQSPLLTAPDTSLLDTPDARRPPAISPDVAVRWNEFRRTEQARYLVLVQPRMLLRLPYGRDNVVIEEFAYEESVDGTDSSRYLWGNPAWALAARISAAWTAYGWCAAIQSSEGGGLVEGLPLHMFRTDEGDLGTHPPTEIVVTERAEGELFDMGFCSLCHYRYRGEAVFPRVPTCRLPGGFLDAEANWNDRFGSQLPFVLAVCRFALAVRVFIRDNRGRFSSPQSCEEAVNRWISGYVLLDENAAGTTKAAFPLREAKVGIQSMPAGDHWRAALFVRPHFQLEGLTTSLRVLVDLPGQT
jgi:type VI secretion system protein ImpC